MKTALEIKNLKKVYASGHTALKGIKLRVEQGDFFALLGPNGAGKSTTIGIITSLVNKTEGQVWVHGFDVDEHPEQAKDFIGLVPQDFNFNGFEGVLDVLIHQAGYYGVPSKTARKHAKKQLLKLELWDRRFSEVRSLSGGMRRRLMIARAMVHHPRLLILDEPTAGVDIEIRRMIWDYLRELNRNGTTIILTTHYLEEAERLCRTIAIISDGEIIADTDMRSLLEKTESESFTLYLRQPLSGEITLPAARSKLIDDHTLEVIVRTADDLPNALQDLRQRGIRLSGIRNTSNRLEELFLQLVAENE